MHQTHHYSTESALETWVIVADSGVMNRTALISLRRRTRDVIVRRATADPRSRHAERAATRRLRNEIASYDTPSAIADLLASASRSESGDAGLVRDVLTHNLELVEHSSTR
jgi:hypothetical protein